MKLWITVLILTNFKICFALVESKVNDGILLRDSQLPQIIVLSSVRGGICTSQLIGPKVLLTAAHCCEGGAVHANKLSPTVNFKIHPDYRKITSPYFGLALPEIYVLENDLCLIELESTVKDIAPFSLPKNPPQQGNEHIIVGAGEPHVGNRQYGFMNIVKVSEKGIQAQGFNNFGRPGDSGGALLSGSLGQDVFLEGISSVSTYFCGYQGVIYTSDNKYRCADEATKIPSEVFVPSHTTGFVSLKNSSNVLFLNNFVAESQVEICGLNLNCKPVRFE